MQCTPPGYDNGKSYKSKGAGGLKKLRVTFGQLLGLWPKKEGPQSYNYMELNATKNPETLYVDSP